MRSNPALKTLFIYNGIFVFAANLLGPLYAVYLQKFDTNVFSISLTWAVLIFSATTFTYLLSKFGDHLKEKESFLMAGFLIRCIAWFLFIFANNITIIIGIQIILGLGEAFGSPTFDAIISEHIDKDQRMAEYSAWKIISNFSIALSTIIGGYIVSLFGFTPLFLAMSILALFCFFGILTKPRNLL